MADILTKPQASQPSILPAQSTPQLTVVAKRGSRLGSQAPDTTELDDRNACPPPRRQPQLSGFTMSGFAHARANRLVCGNHDDSPIYMAFLADHDHMWRRARLNTIY